MRQTLAAFVAALTFAAVPAVAGIADSPLPVIDPNGKTIHLYSVPGVMFANGFALGTLFSCTSTSASPQTVGVELFASAGGGALNNAATTAATLAPGAGVVFITGGGCTFPTTSLGAPVSITGGSARILSTSKSLICTAFVADCSGGGFAPISAWQLTIVAKTKQKAAN